MHIVASSIDCKEKAKDYLVSCCACCCAYQARGPQHKALISKNLFIGGKGYVSGRCKDLRPQQKALSRASGRGVLPVQNRPGFHLHSRNYLLVSLMGPPSMSRRWCKGRGAQKREAAAALSDVQMGGCGMKHGRECLLQRLRTQITKRTTDFRPSHRHSARSGTKWLTSWPRCHFVSATREA